MRLLFDLSNYSRLPEPAQLQCLKSQGFDTAILGAQVGADGLNYTQQQIDACRLVGIEPVGVYELLYWDNRDMDRMEHAASFGLPVWVDCEFRVPGGWAAANVVDRIAAATGKLGSSLAGIYTGRWWWKPNTGDSRMFADKPLWHAEYGVKPFEAFEPYGGWERPTIWQYSNKGLCAVNCDLNAWAVSAPEPSQEAQLRGLVAAAYIVSVGNPLTDLSPEDRAALKYVAGQL